MTKSRTNADNVTADIAGITAGTGITGGGTSGTVTITNDMATTIAAAGDLIYGTANDAYAALSLGTAGKVLKVNSGATAPEWAVDPTTDVVTTAGDLIYGTGADAVARLGIGTASQFLAVNSGATAPEWVAAPSSNMNWTKVGSDVSLSGVASVTISGITGADKLFILIGGSSPVNAGAYKVKIKINNDTGSVYYPGGIEFIPASTYIRSSLIQQFNAGSGANNEIRLGNYSSNATSILSGTCFIYGGNSSGKKMYQAQAGVNNINADNGCSIVQGGWYDSSSTISSIVIDCDDGYQNWDAGTVQVFKSA